MDNHVEIFAPKKETASIICPKCKLKKIINIKNILTQDHRSINVICKRCFHEFTVTFNFRKYYRKPVNLVGFIFSSLNAQDPLTEIVVIDVSLDGVGFISPVQIINKNSIFTIRFYLDNFFEKEIEREIRIVSNRKEYYGVKFFDKNIFNPLLYNYIIDK